MSLSGNESKDPTATPNTVLTHELENATLPDAKKQRQEAPVAAEVAKPKRSFKAVANLVLAMKRFQSALNPTYEYGKQTSSQRLSRAVRQTSPTASASSGERVEPRSISQTQEQYSFADRGHKASILFNRLPETPETLSEQD